MVYSEESRLKRQATEIAKYGSLEGYREAMRQRGAIGGSKKSTKPKGFAVNRELAAKHGKINGLLRKKQDETE
jgi:hypothetical protein